VASGETFFLAQRNRLDELAAHHAALRRRLHRAFPSAWGITSAGFSRGEKPADLPVQQATKVELVINLKNRQDPRRCHTLPLLDRADLVIE
jgi:putative ABC transport system substrate-binding protein